MSLRNRLINLGATGVILGAATFLGPVEQPVLTPYADIGGVPTWCYGETLGTPKARYTLPECDASLLLAVERHWVGIRQYVPQNAPLSVQEAMLSVAYSTGTGGWRHPVFLGPLAKGDWKGTCDAIVAPWKGARGVALGFKATVKGKPVRGLENRRAKEAALCRRDL